MPRKQSPEPLANPELTVSREEAKQKIQAQIQKGLELKNPRIQSEEEFKRAQAAYDSWNEYNATLLRRLFTNDALVQDYEGCYLGGFAGLPLLKRVEEFNADFDRKIRKLESIKLQLELYPEPRKKATSPTQNLLLRGVFIVHRHDEAA